MITDLRFIERMEPYPVPAQRGMRLVRILQYYDGHNWFDVPMVREAEEDQDGEA